MEQNGNFDLEHVAAVAGEILKAVIAAKMAGEAVDIAADCCNIL
jgi:hypothetical protein